jgi:hypothetical protein
MSVPTGTASADQVPTWNYVSVEAEGSVAPLSDDEFVALLDDLSAQEEARLLPKTPWTRDKMSPAVRGPDARHHRLPAVRRAAGGNLQAVAEQGRRRSRWARSRGWAIIRSRS